MEIYLIRHTETVCEKGICYGQANVAIKEPYQDLFQSIKEQIPQEAIVYSSPLKRCLELANHLSSSVLIDDRLMEMNFGDWELKSWDAIPSEALNPWMQDFVNVSVPNGESFVALYARVIAFIKELQQHSSQKPIAIVTHAGVIRSVLCHINQIELKDAFQTKVNFGEVIKVEI